MLLRSKGPQDAEQNLMHSIAEGIDIADLLVARVPKPTLMVTTTRDMFSIQGARDVSREVSAAYQAYESEENMQMVEDDAEHASTLKNREATYAFFQKQLNHPGNPKEEEVTLCEEKELVVTPMGQIRKSLPSEPFTA
jgi:hypothetical protein